MAAVEHLGLGLRVLLARSRLLGDDLEPPLHRREVREHQVERELLELGHRVGVRPEAARDLDQHVGLPRERDPLRAAARRRVLDADLGRRRLLRAAPPPQPIEALVRDVDHADAIGAAACGQSVEQRGLARPGGADDGDGYRH